MSGVPIIDISALGSSEAPPAAIVDAVSSAAADGGFFQVIGHGIDGALVERVWAVTREFFALDMEQKRSILRTKENSRGFYDRELTKQRRDQKEVFDWATVPFPDLPHDHPDNFASVDGCNQWPDALPDLKPVLMEYLDACEALSFRLLAVFAAGLGVDTAELAAGFDRHHTSAARLNHYPLGDVLTPAEAAAETSLGDMALHHHTDAGALTVLLQDEVGGLQVETADGWADVEPVEGAFVVNTGDIMQVWSNDRYVAAHHRVRPVTVRERYSIPYFFNPSYATDYAPLDAVIEAHGEPARYRAINWGAFRQGRADGDFADYGTENQISDFRIG